MASFLQSWLPQAEGILPYWLLITSVAAIGNCIQTYSTLKFTRRVYPLRFVRNPHLPAPSSTFNPEDSTQKLVPASTAPSGSAAAAAAASDQVTPLASRCFGTWTVVSAVVRFYAAYNLHVGPVYDIAIWTYVVALAHFSSELLVYKTMDFGLPQFFPFFVSTSALIWLPSVRSFYVQA